MSQVTSRFGPLLREWRQRRRFSQLDLACEGNISARHLSFLETGRSRPSREMVLHLAEQLEIPLRDRNDLLVAAGFAPAYREGQLNDPGLRAARQAMEAVIHGHMPWPALAFDRHWTMVIANGAVSRLLAGVDQALLAPPVNVLRLALHPSGLAQRTINLPAWRAHLLGRLQRQVEVSRDKELEKLLYELRGYDVTGRANLTPSAPDPRKSIVSYPATGDPATGDPAAGDPAAGDPAARGWDASAMVVPFELSTEAGTLTFISMTTVFGTPMDITLSELAIECFFPADEATARILSNEQPARKLTLEVPGGAPGGAWQTPGGTR